MEGKKMKYKSQPKNTTQKQMITPYEGPNGQVPCPGVAQLESGIRNSNLSL